MNNTSDQLDTQPWYKQGWPWALIAIPFLTVIAGVITYMIAADTSDSLVNDDYYKKGLAINSNIERTEIAAQLNLQAELSIDHESNLLSLMLSSAKTLPTELTLSFSHPTQKNKDKQLIMPLLSGNEYVAELLELEQGYWHILIEDKDKNWLLKGRWLYPSNHSIEISAGSSN